MPSLLDKNERPSNLPVDVKSLFLEKAARLHFNRYPDPDYRELRDRLSSYCGFPADRLVLGNGGDEILWMTFTSWVKPGDTVLAFSPTFSEYHRLAELFGSDFHLVPADLEGDEPVFDYEAFLRTAERLRPSLILLDTPNNPTGLSHPASFIGETVSLCESVIVVDEAYGEFAASSWLGSMRGRDLPSNVIVLKTMSKAWGLAGLRLGYAVCGERTASALNRVRAPFNVNCLSSAAAEIALEHSGSLLAWIEDAKRVRDCFIGRVNSIYRWRAFASDANFVLVRSPFPWDTVSDFLEGIYVKRVFYPTKGGNSRCWLRVSVGEESDMDSVITAFLRLQKEVGCHD